MVAISSGAMPWARRSSGSLPSVGPMVLPEPVSTSAHLPLRRSRNALTEIGKLPLRPASRSSSAFSMPSTTSSGAVSTPSLSVVTSMSPMVLVYAAINGSSNHKMSIAHPHALAAAGIGRAGLAPLARRYGITSFDDRFAHRPSRRGRALSRIIAAAPNRLAQYRPAAAASHHDALPAPHVAR